MMRLLRYLDALISRHLNQHITLTTPLPLSTSPTCATAPATQHVEYPHCSCCLAWTPQPCPVVHLTPCGKAECGQVSAG